MEILLRLIPLTKELREQIIASIQKKESRRDALENERSSLGRQLRYVTYAALSLQILGLMLILTKDLL